MITPQKNPHTLTQEFIFSFKPDLEEGCNKFAVEVIETIPYLKSRGQTDKQQIIEQTTCGKKGEFGVYDLFVNHRKVSCSKPDLKVTRKKSYAADLMVNGHKCHVKTISEDSAARFGISWTFQYADKDGNTKGGHRDREIFDSYGPDDSVCFVLMGKSQARILACVKVSTLHEKELFDLPRVPYLQKSKRCVYFDKGFKTQPLLEKLSADQIWESLP